MILNDYGIITVILTGVWCVKANAKNHPNITRNGWFKLSKIIGLFFGLPHCMIINILWDYSGNMMIINYMSFNYKGIINYTWWEHHGI